MNTHVPADELTARLDRMRGELRDRGLHAALITPGSALRYLTGYRGDPDSERLTALVLPADGEVQVLCPLLEEPLVRESVGGLAVRSWRETEVPLDIVADLLPRGSTLAVDERMWAGRSLALRRARPDVDQVDARELLRALRLRKSPWELDALRAAGSAIDSVHAAMGDWLRAGRTERAIGADIADAIVQAGHAVATFVIVASGPNGASPHAEVSDRVVGPGEPVVVDIGGAMPDGYNSDSTRTYVIGEPPAGFTTYYEVLQRAQQVQRESGRAGMAAAELDSIGRTIIAEAGYGERFVHRTGHGIGLDVHEDPYVVEGNDEPLETGTVFSIEPGIYVPGEHGARIEDIVICTADGLEPVNRRPHELGVLAG